MADSHKLFPDDVVREIRSQSEVEFTRRWRDTGVLLVRIEDESSELATWLLSTASDRTIPLAPSREGIGYETGMSTLPKIAAAFDAMKAQRLYSAGTILADLEKASYFIAPLRKRGSEGKPFAERISVGRARNNDIVLRHSTVSKFHAWFECDDDNLLFLNDAKSTNHTSVGGQILEPGESRKVSIGAEVKFGEVTCVVCSPKMTWEIVSKH
jgi:hypothetical protein